MKHLPFSMWLIEGGLGATMAVTSNHVAPAPAAHPVTSRLRGFFIVEQSFWKNANKCLLFQILNYVKSGLHSQPPGSGFVDLPTEDIILNALPGWSGDAMSSDARTIA